MNLESARKKAEPYLTANKLVFVGANGTVRCDLSPFQASEYFASIRQQYWAFEQVATPNKKKK